MNRFIFSKFIVCVCILISCSITGFAQIDKAETEIKEIMQKYSGIGVSVAVVKQNKIIYTHSFGLKNVENNIPLTDQDIFRIASISKSFSATSIMQLVEAGKLSLDDDFSNLVGFKVRNPKFPETVITLKMMLSHRSSLNDSQGYLKLDVINPDKNPDWAKCYNSYEPGKGYEYCNLNFNLIGTVIEKISGERFDNYVKNHLLKPMGLYAGYCVDSLDSAKFVTLYEYHNDTKTFTPAPTAYAPRREEIKNYVMGYSTPIFSPTGGMKISATDLAKYMTMHMNYGNYNGVKIMSKKHAKLMQTKISEEEGYAMAMRSVNDLIPGLTLKGHTGSAYGLYSAMFFDPKEKYGIVVITNGCNPIYSKGYCDLIQASINSLYTNLIK
ncbi:serine hydrolase domain-containing protein [Pedobacter paludis]|uniref:Serine hydrolase n=1 Tax=Pedobacter paludis TaxID=2203212 RepID=A0A317F3F0_9SPHI|nr:serine hydrolase domain-containing protein [Pedobacter paludis]PWS33112.1 serine hydrolase [Pedobacter paludis]